LAASFFAGGQHDLQAAHVRRKFFAHGCVDTVAGVGPAHALWRFPELISQFCKSPKVDCVREFEYRRLAAACLDWQNGPTWSPTKRVLFSLPKRG
jgi:hypothetical protein